MSGGGGGEEGGWGRGNRKECEKSREKQIPAALLLSDKQVTCVRGFAVGGNVDDPSGLEKTGGERNTCAAEFPRGMGNNYMYVLCFPQGIFFSRKC